MATSLREGQPDAFRQPSASTSWAKTSKRSVTRCQRANSPAGSPCASQALLLETGMPLRDTVTICIPEGGRYPYAPKLHLHPHAVPPLCPHLLHQPRPLVPPLSPAQRPHSRLDHRLHSWRTASLSKWVVSHVIQLKPTQNGCYYIENQLSLHTIKSLD